MPCHPERSEGSLKGKQLEENGINQAIMKNFLKKYWWCIIIIVFAPIVINYLLLIPAIGPVVGNNIHWLAFWGSYLAALIPTVGAFMILYIQRRDSLEENEKRRKENDENRNLQINILKYQQEMQWLNEKKGILIDFALSLNKDDLIELSNKIAANQDILPDIKRLLADLVLNDSRIGFMRVSEKTESFKVFNTKRQSAFNTYRDSLLDLQEVNIIFLRTTIAQRNAVLNNHLQQGLIHDGLRNIMLAYPSEYHFIHSSPVEISIKLIAALPDLLEDTRKAALDYVKSEEERLAKLLEDN